MLFERNPHPMWVFDRETLRFLAVNDTAIHRYGYSREEFLSMTLRDIRPPEDIPAMVEKLVRCADGLNEAGVWRHRKKDGETVYAEIVSHDLMFAGRAARLVLANDVTRRKMAEDALRETNAELSAYQSLITHDIGNFTMALLGITEYLLQKKDGGLTDKQDEFLRRANRQGMEMFRLVENARLLVRLREKGLPASVESVCMGETFDRAVATVRSLHFDRPFRFSLEGMRDLKVTCVPLLDNIILNLVDNAVRHTPRAVQPIVRVRVCEEGEFVQVSIRGGASPDKETCSNLFRRHHRGRHSSGSGLGLALVGEIVRRVNGTIEARRAEEPEGPVFEVVMKLKRA
jgi:PAS domain S-box-containing protein